MTRAGWTSANSGPDYRAGDDKPVSDNGPTYHDLHITTAVIPRASIFSLPYGLQVICTRASGWELWDMNRMQYPEGLPPSRGVLLAGEYADPGEWLVLDVAGQVIVDSRRDEETAESNHPR